MGLIELLLLALALAMDAFAVSVANGMCIRRIKASGAFAMALSFGIFQGLMPIVGFLLGKTFASYIEHIDHYIAFVLLGVIGGKMIYEAIKEMRNPEEYCDRDKMTFAGLMVQSVATSIDALIVGVTFAAIGVGIIGASSIIALITFLCCFAGVFIGKRCGDMLSTRAEIVGGIVLVGIGLKIFIEHMFF